jgi:N-acetylglucosaminyldiphosphoundecaprenol N-acetyl-beta-D-mannosaminyltransferase
MTALGDVLLGRARLVGARHSTRATPGWISPADARARLGLAYDDPARIEEMYERGRSWRSDLAVCARSVLARAIPGGGVGPTPPRLRVGSVQIDNLSVEEAVAAVCAPPPEMRARLIHFVHAHALDVAARDAAVRRQLAAADLVLGDGVGLRIAAAMLGARLRANVNGTDLFPRMLQELEARGTRVALVGGAPGVAARCAAWIGAKAPRLEVALVASGFVSDGESVALAEQLRALAPCVLLVGMGTPLQERWVWRHVASIPRLTAITVGGLFDYYAGVVRRAPVAWREVGLEWLYRLAQEPRRLARRNLLGHPAFLARVAVQRLRDGAAHDQPAMRSPT